MAEAKSPQPKKPNTPKPAAEAPRKPLQVLHISRREEKERSIQKTPDVNQSKNISKTNNNLGTTALEEENYSLPEAKDPSQKSSNLNKDESRFNIDDLQGQSMADLIGPSNKTYSESSYKSESTISKGLYQNSLNRTVDDFDFDEDAFLAALEENEPVGTTGEIISGKVIAVESDGVFVDIGGKAPGFMPKNECGLGVITNLRERFSKGLEVEVLVTKEQNADGIVTISCRALELRKSWDKVRKLEKEGKVLQVKVNGFNRGGVICDIEGLRGFIPRSQLEQGGQHESLVGKSIGVAFLEVNPDNRKLVLSEKKAKTLTFFTGLEIGQLANGKIVAIKPYGFFVDIGGISGLLHHSMVTGGSIRSLREVFNYGEEIKALITELDPGRGRIGLNTALLENQPGEIITNKEKVMLEAHDRANHARKALLPQEESIIKGSDDK